MNRILAGGIAGFAATVPMTLFMIAAYRRLPREEQYPLPPAEGMMEAAEKVGLNKHLDTKAERQAAVFTAHFSYGTAVGAIYGVLGPQVPLPAPVKGSLYGLAVWSISYLGLMPALGLLKPATEHPARRNALMIAAHLVWGTATAMAADALADTERQ